MWNIIGMVCGAFGLFAIGVTVGAVAMGWFVSSARREERETALHMKAAVMAEARQFASGERKE